MALDPVNAKAVKGKFKDREDKDLDNDGDSDASDEYLHKRRSAVSKAIKSVKESKMTPDQMRKALDDDKANAKSKDKVSLKKAPWDMKKEEVKLDEKYDTPVKKKPVSMMTKDEKDKNDERRKSYKEYQKSLRKEEVESITELTAEEKRLIDTMYDKKGNLTDIGKKVMDHGKKNRFPHNTSASQGKMMSGKSTMYSEETMDEAISGDQYYYVDPKGVVVAVGNKDSMRKMNMKQAKDGNKGGSFSQNRKKYKVGDKIDESVKIDEISMGKMAAYADKAVKSRNDAKAATYSADSNRRDKAQKTIVKRKAGADNYNKKMWGYSNVAPTKESVSRVLGRIVEAKSSNMIHIGHPDDYTDDAWKHEVFIAGKKVTSGSHFKLDGKTFRSVDEFVRVLAKKYNVPETSFDLYSFDDNGKNPKLYQSGWKPRKNVRESNESVSRVFDRMVEAKDNYTIAHKTFSSAVQHAEDVTKKRGFEIDPDVWDRKVAMGPRKPGVGKTNSYNIDLMKNGKDVKQKLHMQVYYDEGRYELNMYIS